MTLDTVSVLQIHEKDHWNLFVVHRVEESLQIEYLFRAVHQSEGYRSVSRLISQLIFQHETLHHRPRYRIDSRIKTFSCKGAVCVGSAL